MITYLHKKFYINIQKLSKKQLIHSILIAISGGQDSLCLIKLIQYLKKYYIPSLIISYIYIDYQWKKDSQEQIKHLINIINNNGEVNIYQVKEITISENKARNLRYKIIIRHALKYKHQIIMTAHTNTDTIETFLQQLMRGTSIDGATSLVDKRIISDKTELWRPLLNFKRIEISWFCRKYYIPIWSDITNYEYSIQRNRLRNEFIPYLKKYFCKDIDKKIDSFLNICKVENEYIKQNAIKLYLKSCHKYNMALKYSLLNKQHIALQSRTLQIFFYHNLNKCLPMKILKKIILKIHNDKIKPNTIQWNQVYIKIQNQWLYIY